MSKQRLCLFCLIFCPALLVWTETSLQCCIKDNGHPLRWGLKIFKEYEYHIWQIIFFKNVLLARCLGFSFSEGSKGPVTGSEMPANSELLGQHMQVQAILTSNCSLTECTCLGSSSVTLNQNRLQCVSTFNSHLPGNYTTMNSNCKQTLNPTWLNASSSLLRTWG